MVKISYVVLFLTFLLGCKIQAQEKCKETSAGKELVSNLSNSYFEVSSLYVPKITLINRNSILDQIRSSKGEFNCDIFKGLYDINKTIICHLLLTNSVVESEPILEVEYLYNKDNIIGAKYTVNNLNWLWSPEKEHYVNRANQLEIINYWRKILGY